MRKLLLAILFLAVAVAPVCADQVSTFVFAANAGDIGKVDVFTSGPDILTLRGYSAPGVLADMWEKDLSPSEIGIGLAGQVDHEIGGNFFVQLDLTQILALHPTSVVQILDSIQAGENYDVWGSNTAGQLGTLLLMNQTGSENSVPSLGTFDFISITSGSAGDVTLEDVVVTQPTPEPGTFVMFGLGIGLLLAARKLRVAHG